jgi:hypothetical protein
MTIQRIDSSGWRFVSHPTTHKPRIRLLGCSPNFQAKPSKLLRRGTLVAIMIWGLAAPPVEARSYRQDQYLSDHQSTGLQLARPFDRRRLAGKARRQPTPNRSPAPVGMSAIRPSFSVRIVSADAPSPEESRPSSEHDANGSVPKKTGSKIDSEISDTTAPATHPTCPRSALATSFKPQSAVESPVLPPPQPIITLRRIILLGVLAAGFGLLAFVRR